MKRYWVTWLLAPLIVLSIGTYYIQASFFTEPEFVIETVEGDKQIGERIMLHGHYGNSRNFIRKEITIDTGGSQSENSSILSAFASNSSIQAGEDWQRLTREHRQFMRGKRNPESMFADDKLLAYVTARPEQPSTFDVSVLHKASGQASSYQVSIPDGHLYAHIQIQEVQVVGEQLKVVGEVHKKNGDPIEAVLYTLSLTSPVAPSSKVLLSYRPEQGDLQTNVRKVHSPKYTQPTRYITYSIEQAKITRSKDGSYQSVDQGANVYVYDISSGQKVSVNAPELTAFLAGKNETENWNVTAEGDVLYLSKGDAEGFAVLAYSITDGTTMHLQQQGRYLRNPVISEGRVYQQRAQDPVTRMQVPDLEVFDLKSGSVLYRGKVSAAGTQGASVTPLSNLRINTMEIR